MVMGSYVVGQTVNGNSLQVGTKVMSKEQAKHQSKCCFKHPKWEVVKCKTTVCKVVSSSPRTTKLLGP